TATRLVKSPVAAILVSVGLGLAYVWFGIFLAAASGRLPVSFFIATLSFLVYLPVRLISPVAREAA
ncbi:MAG: metal ABC transporter permease, partial [Spirochaetia bacterium]